MSEWIADGTAFAAILALTVLEGIMLALFHRATGRGLRAMDVLFHLAAGAMLLLAAFLALRGAWYGWVGLTLAGAGAAHLIDLRRRLGSTVKTD